MKIKLSLISILIAGFFLLSSCHKGHDCSETKTVTLYVNVHPGDLYQLDLSKYGDADDIAFIGTQATQFTRSDITTNPSGRFIYSYSATTPTKMASHNLDKVLLKLTEPANRRHIEETDITIIFDIN